MSVLRKLGSGLRVLFRRARADQELESELHEFLEAAAEERIKQGLSRTEAARAVGLEHGNLATTKEFVRAAGWEAFAESCWRDLRFALRMLVKTPGFTIIAVLTLALGIGANTAIFQLLDAVTMRSLPVTKPNELVEVNLVDMSNLRGSMESWHPVVTHPIWEELVRRQRSFSSLLAWSGGQFNLSPVGEPRWAAGLEVSGSFFRTLGVQPALGRLLVDSDDDAGCSPGVVLSYAFWQREFGGDPSIVGRRITLEHGQYDIIGVAPPNFTGLEVGRKFDVAVPICGEAALNRDDSRLNSGVDWWLIVMGRLKPGWTVEKARAELGAISPGVFEASVRPDYPKASVPQFLQLELTAKPAGAGISQIRESYSRSLWMLFGITGLVLLIACANLANLTLARTSAREREWTVRSALGASRGRLLRQTLTESVSLAVTGTILGAWLATLLGRLLIQFIATEGNPIFLPMGLDWRTLAFTSSVAAATCILFGLAPALKSTGASAVLALRSSGRGATPGRGRLSTRRILIVCQVAFSLILLVEALLFTRSFVNLISANTGLDSHGVVISYIDFSRLNLSVERRQPFKSELMHRLKQVPGIEAVSETSIVPLSGSSRTNNIWMQGSDSSQQTECFFSEVGEEFFQTMGISLLAGRNFQTSDLPSAPSVAVVNETFVRQVLNGQSPVGLEFWREATPRETEMKFQIVGLVKDSKYRNLWEGMRPTIYLAQSQDAKPSAFAQVLIRSALPPATLLPAVKDSILRVSPDITPTFQVFGTMVHDSLTNERLMAWLCSFFGMLAILLAGIGLYGVISYMVLQRRNELGIRMALGADRRSILRMFLGETALLLLCGCVVGGILSLVANRAARAVLFGLKTSDPLTLFGAVILVATVALMASLVPTRRAMRVDPVVALRYE